MEQADRATRPEQVMEDRVSVSLLDGRKHTFSYKDENIVEDVEKAICALLQINKDNCKYFGLFAKKKIPSTKLVKDVVKNGEELKFRLKYYPDSSNLTDAALREMLYHQLKEDVRSGKSRMECPIKCRCLLEAYVIQIEKGDYSKSSMIDYTSNFTTVSKDELPGIQFLIAEMHSTMRGMSRTQAVKDFVEYASGLPTYGMRRLEKFYKVKTDTRLAYSLATGPGGVLVFYNCKCDDKKKQEITRYQTTYPWEWVNVELRKSLLFLINEKSREKERIIKVSCPLFKYQQLKKLYKRIKDEANFYKCG